MRVLSIGNSFSQDAHKWLHQLAEINGIDMETVNLYIGGCSLEMHWNNVVNDNAYYDLELNGNAGVRKTGIKNALAMEDWDVITVQQVSGHSGLTESYEPYLSNLVSVIKNTCPNAKLYFHQTWAYETDSSHDDFVYYHHDQRKMFEQIVSATEQAAKSIGAQLIPSGTLVQRIRETVPEFDYQNGGLSLCRDGFHMSYDYGRYAVAATWLRVLAGVNVKADGFEDFDLNLLKKILAVVNEG